MNQKLDTCDNIMKNNITIRLILIYLLMLTYGFSQDPVKQGKAEPRKNILVILSDDQGYCELEPFINIATKENLDYFLPKSAGAPHIPLSQLKHSVEEGMESARRCMPNISKLSTKSVVFTDFYSAPTCAPARAALMTGCYPQRFGVYTNWDTVSKNRGLNPDAKMLVKLFKDSGYYTGLVGKWHLGDEKGQHPNDKGFEYFFGFDRAHTEKYDSKILFRNRESVPAVGWLADQITQESVDFIQRSDENSKPFFLYVAYNEPHGPNPLPPKMYQDEFKSESHRITTHYGNIYGMDYGIGKIIQKLKDIGQFDNTLIVFLSDNGVGYAPIHPFIPGSGPFRGGKWSPWEGGVRVPAVIYAKEFEHKTSNEICTIFDLLPTALDYAKISIPKDYVLDGKSLIPILKGKPNDFSERQLYWACDSLPPYGSMEWDPKFEELENRMIKVRDTTKAMKKEGKTHNWRGTTEPPALLVRNKKWKLMRWEETTPILIDMINDPYERKNVASEFPEVVAKLHGDFKTWMGQMPKPVAYSDELMKKLLITIPPPPLNKTSN